MRIDHFAFRVKDRLKTAKFFVDALGYKIATEFSIEFDQDDVAQCLVLEPPEKKSVPHEALLWRYDGVLYWESEGAACEQLQEYHLPPEIFISDGGKIVSNWVAARHGIGGLHHIAYLVNSVEKTMKLWQDKGYAEFSSDKPFTCPGLTQVFTKPSEICGVIFELIEREEVGFCRTNVKNLMKNSIDLFQEPEGSVKVGK